MVLFLVTVAVAFELLASLPPAPLRFLSAALALALLAREAAALLKERAATKALAAKAYTLSAFLAWQLLRSGSAAFSRAVSEISGGFSAFVGIAIGRPISMGPTYSGIDTVALFLFAMAAAAIAHRRGFARQALPSPLAPRASASAAIAAARSCAKSCGLWLLGVALIWGFYVAAWTYLAENSIGLGLNLVEPLTGPLDYRAALFAMLLAFYARICANLAKRDTGGQALRGREMLAPAGLAALLAAASIFAAATAPDAPSATGATAVAGQSAGRVVFWDTGLDFSVPEHGKYGLDYAGMFGVLPRYLAMEGYECLTAETLSAEILGWADALAVINPMRAPDESELDLIWRFAESGGAVLAVGDHTGMEQVRQPLNAILSPSGISFNFDSAVPFKSLWADDFRLWRSPLFAGIGGRQIQMVVGASLSAGPGAKPLIVGRAGYSDAGDAENAGDGYLGNMQFERGERIGDLVLAAEARHGKGLFLAFGDTSHFQNTVLSYSFPFVDNIFAYLCAASGRRGPDGRGEPDEPDGQDGRDGRDEPDGRGALESLPGTADSDGERSGLPGAAEGAVAQSGQSGSAADGSGGLTWTVIDRSGALPGTADSASAWGSLPGSAALERGDFFRGTCLIDASHLELFDKDKSGGSVDGLIACALRAGLMPRLVRDGTLAQAMERAGGAAAAGSGADGAYAAGAGGGMGASAGGGAEFVFIIEPAAHFSAGELSMLERFMEGGGSVVLCAGYGSPDASAELAAHFGFSFDAMPIGRIAPEQDPEMAFWNACPVLYDGASPQDGAETR
ncbi:MAG: hypothetical protein LBL83_07275, partial [Clostridiales bacterium]|nr:hypothetical protein [Clostridiales bacterium]